MQNHEKNRWTLPNPGPGNSIRQILMSVTRWSAWILVLCLIIMQLTENMPDEATALGLFVLAGVLYVFSAVLEGGQRH